MFDEVEAGEEGQIVMLDEVEAEESVAAVEYRAEIPFRAQVGSLANVGKPENVNYAPASTNPLTGGITPQVGIAASDDYQAAIYNEYGSLMTEQIGTPASAVYVPRQLYVEERDEVTQVLSVMESHKVRTSVEINIFSESLQTGIILIVQFIAYVEDSPTFGTAPAPLEIIYDNLPGPTTPSDKCGLCVTYDDSE